MAIPNQNYELRREHSKMLQMYYSATPCYIGFYFFNLWQWQTSFTTSLAMLSKLAVCKP